MVRGIELFTSHFADYDKAFVVIGGTASMLLLNEVGLSFRATKDVDVVLLLEAMSPEFGEAFWRFVSDGGYENRQVSSGKPLFYRFWKPNNQAHPETIELFSRKPDGIILPAECHLTPVPIAEEVASLSAILMNDSYYELAKTGRRLVDGLPVLGAEHLIPFKARAWLDLSRRRDEGDSIDERDIRKHKNDVFRLYQIISPEQRVRLSSEVAYDMATFLAAAGEVPPDLSQLGLRGFTMADAESGLRQVYGLPESHNLASPAKTAQSR